MFKKFPLTKLVANPSTSSILRTSKELDKQLLKEPEWDEIGDNTAMAKVISDREIAAVVQEHDRMCEQAIIDAKNDQKRIKKLRAMQKDLRDKFIETNKFINDCQAKCADLDKKIATETEAQQKLQQDIDDQDEEIRDLTDFHENELKPSVDKLKVNEEVLQQVVDEMDIFKSKEDFLDRIDALLLIQKEISENDEVTLEEIEEMKSDVVKLSNDATAVIAGLENKLAEVEKKYEQAKEEYLKWESVLAPTKDAIRQKEKESFMLCDQIQQVYKMLCERNGIEPRFRRDQTEQQLDYIKVEMEIIMQVIVMVSEMVDLETRSDIAEHGSAKSGKPRK